MGFTWSDEQIVEKMEELELQAYKMQGLADMDLMRREYTEIEMDGKPFNVRTVYYGDESKKTLILLHGICAFGAAWGTGLGLLA